MIFNKKQNNKEIFEKIKAGEKNFRGINLSGMNFKNMDLSGCDFTDSDLTKSVFRKAKLDGAVFKNAVLENVSLVKVSAKKCDFSGTVMPKADMLSGDFTESDFTSANLEKAILDGALFKQACMKDAKLIKTILNDVDFTKADLSGVSFSNCDGMDSDFTEANFSRADLTSAVLVYANFTKSNFTNSVLDKGEFNFSNFTEAVFKDTKVSEANMKKIYGVSEEQEQVFSDNGAMISGHYLKKFFHFLWNNKIARVLSFMLICASLGAFYIYFSNPQNRGSAYLMVKADQYESLGDQENAIVMLEIVASRKDVYNKFSAYLTLSDIYYRNGMQEKALFVTSEALRISEDNLLEISLVVDAEKKMIEFLNGIHGIERALEYIKERKTFYKSEEYFIKALSLAEADIYFSLGEHDKANAAYDSLAESADEVVYNNDLKFSIVFFKQAMIAFKEGDNEKVHMYLKQYMDFLAKYNSSELLYAHESERIICFILKFYLDHPTFSDGAIDIATIFNSLISDLNDVDTASDMQFRVFHFFLNQNNTDYISELFEKVSLDFAAHPEFNYFKAVLAKQKGDFDEADAFYREALKTDSQVNILAILLSYVEFLSVRKEYDTAIDILEDFLYIDEHYVDIVMAIVSFLKEQKKYTEALKWLEKVKKYSYYRGNYYAELCRIKLFQGEKEKAYDFFFEAIAAEKDKSNIVNLWQEFLSNRYFLSRCNDDFFTTQLEYYKDSPRIVFMFLRHLVLNYSKKIGVAKTEEYINKYATSYEDVRPYDFYVLKGEMSLLENKYKEAHGFYKKAFSFLSQADIMNSFYHDFNSFMLVCRKENTLSEASEYLNEVRKDIRHADDRGFVSSVKYMLFDLYLELGKIDDAEEILQGVDEFEDIGSLYQKLAQYYLQNKDLNKALSYYRKQFDALKNTSFFMALDVFLNTISQFSYVKETEEFILEIKSDYAGKSPIIKNDINMILARYYLNANKSAEALQVINEIDHAFVTPNQEMYLLVLNGEVSGAQKDVLLSEKAYMDVLFNKKCTADYFFNIFNLLMENYDAQGKSYDDMLGLIDKLIAFHSDKPMLIFTLLDRKVLYLKALSRYGEAEALYEKLIADGSLYLDKLNIYLRYADLFMIQKKYSEALEYYREALPIVMAENAGELLFSVSKLFVKTKAYEAWGNFVDEIAKRYSGDTDIMNIVTVTKAKIHFAQGNSLTAFDMVMSVENKDIVRYDFLEFHLRIFKALLKDKELLKAKQLAEEILQAGNNTSFEQSLWMFDSLIESYITNVGDVTFLNDMLKQMLIDYSGNTDFLKVICLSLIKINIGDGFDSVKKYFDVLEKEGVSSRIMADVKFLKAQAFFNQGGMDEAVGLYMQLLDGNIAGDYRLRAFESVSNIYRQKGMHDELSAFMEKYRDDSSRGGTPLGRQIFLSDIAALIASGDIAEAKQKLLDFLDVHKGEDNFAIYLELAVVYRKEKRFDDAITLYEELADNIRHADQVSIVVTEILNVINESALAEGTDPYIPLKQFTDKTMEKYANDDSVLKACIYSLVAANRQRDPQQALKYIADLEQLYNDSEQDVPFSIFSDKIAVLMNMGESTEAFKLFSGMENMSLANNVIAEAAQSIISSLQENRKNEVLEDFVLKSINKYGDNTDLLFFFKNSLAQHYRHIGSFSKSYDHKQLLFDEYPERFKKSNRSLFDYNYEMGSIAMAMFAYEKAYAAYSICLDLIYTITDENVLRETVLNFVRSGIALGKESDLKAFIASFEKKHVDHKIISLALLEAKAMLAKQDGDMEVALSSYLKVFEKTQGTSRFNVLAELEQVCRVSGEYRAVLDIYSNLLENSERLNKDTLMFCIQSFLNLSFAADKSDEAQVLVDKILQDKKDDYAFYQRLLVAVANGLMENKNPKEVYLFVKQSIDLDNLGEDVSYELYNMLAGMYMAMADYSQARVYYQKVLNKVPAVSVIGNTDDFITAVVFEILKTLRLEGDIPNLEKHSNSFTSKYSSIPRIEFVCLFEKAFLKKDVGLYEDSLSILLDLFKHRSFMESDKAIVYDLLLDVYAGLKQYEKLFDIAQRTVDMYANNDEMVVSSIIRLFSIEPSESYMVSLEKFLDKNFKIFHRKEKVLLDVKMHLGTFYMNFIMIDQALEVFRDIANNFSLDADEEARLNLQMASAFAKKGMLNEARKKLVSFLDYSDKSKLPEDQATRNAIVVEIFISYLTDNDIETGFSFLDEISARYADDKLMQEMLDFQKAAAVNDVGRNQKALRLFSAFLETYPESRHKVEVFRRLAELHRADSNYDEAISFYHKTLEADSQAVLDNLWVIDSLFYACFESGKTDEALKFKKMLEDKYAENQVVIKKLKMLDGKFFVQQKLYDKALSFYSENLSTTTDSDRKRDILENMAMVYQLKGDAGKMLEVYTELLGSDFVQDEFKNPYISEIINFYNSQGDNKKLEEFLFSALKKYTNNREINYTVSLNLARVLKYQDTSQKALELLTDMLSKYKEGWRIRDMYMEFADIYRHKGEFLKAAGYYEKILFFSENTSDDVRNSSWMIGDAVFCYKSSKTDYTAGLNLFFQRLEDKFADYEGVTTIVGIEKAKILLETGREQEAINALKQLVDSCKDKSLRVDVSKELGRMYLVAKKYQEAQKTHKNIFEAISSMPSKQWVAEEIMQYYSDVLIPVEIRESFINEMYELFGDNDGFKKILFLNLARVNAHSGKVDKADGYMQEIYKLNIPDETLVYVLFEHGNMLQAAQKHEEARKYYYKTLKMAANNIDRMNAVRDIVNTYKEEGKTTELESFIESSLKDENLPYKAFFFYHLGLLSKEKAQTEDYEQYMKKALSFADDPLFVFEIYVEMADIYQSKKLYREAAASCLKYIDKNPHDEAKTEMRQRLIELYREALDYYRTENNAEEVAYFTELLN